MTQSTTYRRILLALAASLVLAASPVLPQDVTLTLLQALPVEGLDSAQPSGLTLVQDQLFTVSDKHDHAVLRLLLEDDRAVIEPHVTFNAPWSGAWVRRLDFEGLTYKDGFFFLVSESTFRVLRVHETGSDVTWITPSVEKAGREAGLFGEPKARLKGLAILGPGHLVLAAERSSRGLIDVRIDSAGQATITPVVLDATTLPLAPPRQPDFSDLFFDGQDLYALSRNAEAVIRLDEGQAGLEEGETWSFHDVVADPKYRYTKDTFGRADGLAMDDASVYVILDNNGHSREADPLDKRPLLLRFVRP